MTDLPVEPQSTRYARRREIARGGTSVLYEAEHVVTGRLVALKMLAPPHDADPQHRARLLREARALTHARHPHIVQAYDAGVDEQGAPYLALEMLEGRPLDAILTVRRMLPVEQVVALGVRLAEALAAAHDAGVVHRDVKPGNLILVHENGRETLKLVDFGIAIVPGDSPERTVEPKLTAQNAILGTPDYMAPEQLFDQSQVDARSDVFAAAVSLYECLTGEVPFPSTYPQVLARALAKAPLVHLRRPDVPVALSQVLARAMSADPAHRFTDARAFGDALRSTGGMGVPALSLLGGNVESRHEPAPPSASLRRHARVPFVTPVRILLDGGRTLDGRSVDISQGGMLVMTDAVVEQLTRGTVRFSPPERPIAVLPVEARWVKGGRGRSAIGLKFLDVPDDVLRAISHYVDVLERLEQRAEPKTLS